MRKLRELLRLKAAGLPSRQIGASLGIGGTTVVDYLARARRACLAWPHVEVEKHYYSLPHALIKEEDVGAHNGAHGRGVPQRPTRRRARSLLIQS